MSDELVCVFESQGPLGAEVVLGKLRSEGIMALTRYESVGRALGLTVDGLGLVRVLVARADAARAREILEELDDTDLAGGDVPGGEPEPDESD